MSLPTPPRRRAIRLNREAAATLSSRLEARWREMGMTRKLTWEARADILGLCVVTCRRLLKGEGVDRGSVLLAFASLGLEMSENDLLQEPESDLIEETPSAALHESTEFHPDQEAVPQSVLPTIRRRPHLMVWAACAFAGLFAVVLLCPPITKDRKVEAAPKPVWNAILRTAEASFQRGDYSPARAQLAGGLLLAREKDSAGELANASRLQAELEQMKGRFDLAEQLLLQAISCRVVLNQPHCLPTIQEELAGVEIELGKLKRAEELLSESRAGFRRIREVTGEALVLRDLGSLAARRGQWSVASFNFGKAEALALSLKKLDIVADVRGRRAVMLRDQGFYEEAERLLTLCLDHWRSEKHPRWTATAEYQLGTVAVAKGDLARGTALLERSRAALISLGDEYKVRDCDRWRTRARSGRRLALR